VSGVTPAAVALLMVYVKRFSGGNKSSSEKA
jgi:hypothetical protein